MVKIKVLDASPQALNWAVETLCLGVKEAFYPDGARKVGTFYTDSWSYSGDLIESEEIDLDSNPGRAPHVKCRAVMDSKLKDSMGFYPRVDAFGPTKLIAAMRCLVIATKGHEIEVPEDLA